MRFVLSTFSVHEIVNNTIQEIKTIFNSKGVKFNQHSFIDNTLKIRADEAAFQGIIVTLLKESLSISSPKGSISLHIDTIKLKKDPFLRLAVINSYNASSVKNFNILVDQDYSLASAQSEDTIGFMLAQYVAGTMNGSIEIGKADNDCFVAKLILPIENNYGNSGILNEQHNLKSKRNLSHSRISTVLLVEDQSEMLEYTSEVLSEFYQVIPAVNGAEAWKILKNTNSSIDLVVTDLMMPEMDGFELLEKIRTDEELATTQVALLTARKGDENIIKALSVGVSDYITKPFTKEILLAHCKHLLTNSISRQTPLPDDKETDPENFKNSLKLVDLNWLNQVEQVFRSHMKNKYFNMLLLADELAISERQMRRKLKRITGMSPVQYMNEIKLNNARQMIISEKYATVSEISYEAGFETPKYFSTLFKERYGVNPSELL